MACSADSLADRGQWCRGLAAVGYTLLTGAEVPTVRSCLGALLALAAIAAGRQPFSIRLLAVAAAFVMLLWPEAVIGPSFQMSFGSVLAIVALHEATRSGPFLPGGKKPG
jgi:competence protein ComEC